MKILVVCDRPGWAVDRLCKPIAEAFDNVDLAYFNTGEDRYLDTGYSFKKGNKKYVPEESHDYDIIHFHRLEAASHRLGRLNPRTRKLVSLHTERTAYLDKYDLKAFDGFICPTKYIYNHINERGHEVWHVPTGIDLKRYQYQFKKPNDRTVGFVGRVMKHKRYAHIQRAIKEAELRMIGCGYIDDGAEYSKNRDIEEGDDYDFAIFLPEEQMTDLYSRMNLFVCLSEPNIETGPLPVLEAMACGIPVITTKVGWMSDWCKDQKHVWFIEQDRVDELKYTLKFLYNNKMMRRKLRDNALRLVKDFTIKRYVDNVMEVYKKYEQPRKSQ